MRNESLTTAHSPLKRNEKRVSINLNSNYDKHPNFVELIMQMNKNGVPYTANETQFKHIEKLFNAWYNYQEPKL